MNFRTELSPKKALWDISLKDPVLTMGSCFAYTIGSKLDHYKFPVRNNPFGTTYHPLAIHKILQYAAYHESPPEHTYLDHEGVYTNYDFHSAQSALTRQSLQKLIQETVGAVHYFLKDCKILIMTFGTSWIYERADTGEPVANCHKMPAAFFSKRLTTPDEICRSFSQILGILKSIQPELRIILTVSPVRHVKDTLAMNNVSKSILRVACHEICEQHPNVDYFPAYEIMMDDLRDYRFYRNDLIHPTEIAETYIWNKFSDVYFKPETKAFISQWDEIQKALSHRPFHPESKIHQQFLRETLSKIKELKSTVNVDEELNLIQSQLIRE